MFASFIRCCQHHTQVVLLSEPPTSSARNNRLLTTKHLEGDRTGPDAVSCIEMWLNNLIWLSGSLQLDQEEKRHFTVGAARNHSPAVNTLFHLMRPQTTCGMFSTYHIHTCLNVIHQVFGFLEGNDVVWHVVCRLSRDRTLCFTVSFTRSSIMMKWNMCMSLPSKFQVSGINFSPNPDPSLESSPSPWARRWWDLRSRGDNTYQEVFNSIWWSCASC